MGETKGCKYWTLGKDRAVCWVKSDYNGWEAQSNRVSGTFVVNQDGSLVKPDPSKRSGASGKTKKKKTKKKKTKKKKTKKKKGCTGDCAKAQREYSAGRAESGSTRAKSVMDSNKPATFFQKTDFD